jgi:dipeptidyl aminopeptidase/acylaminoacyl peptidase
MIANAPQGRGGSWSKDDTILYTPDYNVGLLRISAQGGTPEPVTKVDPSRHTTHRWPWFLPDGKHFLYFATNHSGGILDQNGIYFASLDGKENKLVIASDAPGQYASGYLLFHSQTAVMAQHFDPKSGTLSGEAIPVLDRVQYDPSVWWTLFSVSTNGVIAYRLGVANTGTQLTWFDRSGKQLGLAGEHGQYIDARLSPDGKRIATAFGTQTRDIWLLDTARQIKTRLTFDSIPKFQPTWSHDGQRIAYAGLTSEQIRNLALVPGAMPSSANSQGNIYVIQANGVGKPEVVAREPGEILAFPDWSPDGKTIFYLTSQGTPTGHSVYSRPLAGAGKPTLIVVPSNPSANISHFRISPNGRWIAYTSDESGMVQVYVAPASGQGGKWQVSVDGADFPAWRRDGKELFFLNPSDTLYSADVNENGKEFTIGQIHRLFQQVGAASGVPFDVTGDGKRFLFNVGSQDVSAPLNLVVNWTAQVKK